MRIAILEDDLEVRGQLADAVSRLGFEVFACSTVEDAIVQASRERFAALATRDDGRFADPWIRDGSGRWVDAERLVHHRHRSVLTLSVVLYRLPLDLEDVVRRLRDSLAPVPLCPPH